MMGSPNACPVIGSKGVDVGGLRLVASIVLDIVILSSKRAFFRAVIRRRAKESDYRCNEGGRPQGEFWESAWRRTGFCFPFMPPLGYNELLA